MSMRGDGIPVDIRHRAFLPAQHACTIADMIGRQGNICGQDFADRFSRIGDFGLGQRRENGFDRVCDVQQNAGKARFLAASSARAISHHIAGHRADSLKMAPLHRRGEPGAAMIAMARFERIGLVDRGRLNTIGLGHPSVRARPWAACTGCSLSWADQPNACRRPCAIGR